MKDFGGEQVARDFYPFLDTEESSASVATDVDSPVYEARIAVYDDPSVAPRVVVVDPQPTREYLAEITSVVSSLAQEQGGTIPFMIIREVVENYIHAYFASPSVSILDRGRTIRFSDQGPGIADKDRALEYGTTSATPDMRKYIRGVGSGLPIAHQYMADHGGRLSIENNIGRGVVVTISMLSEDGKELGGEEEGAPVLSRRGRLVLEYLDTHESVGPTDLVETYGESQPTWSRELLNLDKAGLLEKRGQKRFLTPYGRTYRHT